MAARILKTQPAGKSSGARAAAARDRRLGPALLAKLATDTSIAVRNAVGMNPATPFDTLRMLAMIPAGR
jgi:hypothetical protein